MNLIPWNSNEGFGYRRPTSGKDGGDGDGALPARHP